MAALFDILGSRFVGRLARKTCYRFYLFVLNVEIVSAFHKNNFCSYAKNFVVSTKVWYKNLEILKYFRVTLA